MEILKTLRIKNIELKNRIAVPPMCTDQAIDGYVNEEHLVSYGMYGRSQFGMITVESTAIDSNSLIFKNDLRISDDSYIEGLKKLSSVIKKYGSCAAIQINHAGRKSIIDPVAPSSIRFSSDYKEPKELSISEVKNLETSFVEGARRAKEAGFDIIEIHAAHGYLINQFLSPLSNHREDEYGGNLINRFTFLKNIITRINEEVNIPLTLRISAEEYHKDGNQFEDFVIIIKECQKLGIDFFSISSGGVIGAIDYGNIVEGYQVHLATALKKATKANVGCVGLISRIKHMEEVVANKESDIIYVGRHTLKHPTWFMNVSSQVYDLPYPYSRIFPRLKK